MNAQNPSTSSIPSALPYKHPDYIKRNADEELLGSLRNGDFCCVLNSPKTGKSSLMVQIFNDLKKEGFLCISIDLTFVEKINYTSDEFYRDFSQELLNNLTENKILSSFDLDNWWLTKSSLGPLYRLKSFITDIILQETSQKLVIFVDEINCTLNFESRSDFFKLIRLFYNRREMTADYKRLTFALFGIATPSELCPNERISPFDVGKNIKLRPFQPHEITPLKDKLVKEINYSEAKATEAMVKILSFTNGHPYLTHCLCKLVIEESTNTNTGTDTNIDQLVEEKIIRGWRNLDCEEHFQRIIRFLSEPNKRSMDLLDLYKEIVLSSLNNCSTVRSKSSDMLQIELKLLGLVLEEDHVLKPYCEIYKQIFNLNWIELQQREFIFYRDDYDNYHNADERQKELYLLTGKILKRTLEWAKDHENIVRHLENRFFEESRQFWNKVQDVFPNESEDKWETIVKAINNLTGGFYQFSNIIFDIIAKNNNVVDLQQDEVQGWLENLVLSNSSNLELFKDDALFIKDRDQFSKDDASIDSFALISTFEKIAQKEPIPFDEKNPQHRKLKDMCFIILDKEHNLRILNKIYEKILDQNWIKKVMAELRPYTKAFRDWQHSDRQESSYLLQNNDLKLALEWLGKKPTPKLEEGEIEFVMTSLVAEVWTTASSSVQSEAVSLITTSRPSLQGKNNYSDFLLREILQWTTSQTAALKKLLEWVNESDIPVENIRKYLEFLVRSHSKNWSYQELFDFALAPRISYPEREQRIFITFDQYCRGEMDQSQIQEPLKECGKILDKYQNLNENDFQELVFNFLKTKIARISLMSQEKLEQKELDVLLDEIVTTSKGHLKSILIFNLENGLPLYHNKRLKSDDPELYHALFADGGDAVGEAIDGFESLSKIQEALDNFGKVTAFGNLTYSIFKLAEGTMMVYFVELTTPFAICFIAPDGINLGLVVTRSQAKIKEIKNELEELGF
jgi:hypothetical protein